MRCCVLIAAVGCGSHHSQNQPDARPARSRCPTISSLTDTIDHDLAVSSQQSAQQMIDCLRAMPAVADSDFAVGHLASRTWLPVSTRCIRTSQRPRRQRRPRVIVASDAVLLAE
jgi:hypothetical protein